MTSSTQPSPINEDRVQMGSRSTGVTPTTRPAAAVGDSPRPSAPALSTGEAPKSAESDDPTVAKFAGLSGPKPATWQWRAPSSQMRAAEYTVPGADGGDQAQIVVYQFPGGGSVENNINRWKTQFRNADGSPVEAKVQEFEADGMNVTIAELTGEYKGMGQTEFRPDQILIAAMIEGDGNPVFVQLTGPSKTVSANRDAYITMLRGIKKSEPMK
jgi:hypothetical protein